MAVMALMMVVFAVLVGFYGAMGLRGCQNRLIEQGDMWVLELVPISEDVFWCEVGVRR